VGQVLHGSATTTHAELSPLPFTSIVARALMHRIGRLKGVGSSMTLPEMARTAPEVAVNESLIKTYTKRCDAGARSAIRP
jgi:hypothetical protein